MGNGIQGNLLKERMMNTKIKYFIYIMMVLTIFIIGLRLYNFILYRKFWIIGQLGIDFFSFLMQIIIYKLTVKKIPTKFAKYLWPSLFTIGMLGMASSIYYANILYKYSYFRAKGLIFFGYPLFYFASLIIYSLLMRYLFKKLSCKS